MEADPVIAQQAGDIFRNIDWNTAGPKLAIACLGVLVCMWICVIIVRKIAKLMIPFIAIVVCAIMVYLIASNQITSTLEIATFAGVLGAMGAVISIPALSLKKDK